VGEVSKELTAIVIGATGLVGANLIQELINDSRILKVKVFTRRSCGVDNNKIEEHLVDFNQLSDYKNEIQGDVLFSCMGTTLKSAGGKAQQYQVDYTYQYQMAQYAKQNDVKDYVLISSTGANVNSSFFYSRMKGELERDVKILDFHRTIFIRPSVLMGDRPEKRLGEAFGAKTINVLSTIIPALKKYKGILGKHVAESMLQIYHTEKLKGVQVFELDQLRKYLK
jgi:uncharacterized protein YbjT (DUF2867 family)